MLERVSFGLLGRKVGMTQIFDEAGNVIPVTVLEVGPCPVLQKKTVESDGYNAVQIGFDDKKKQRINKCEAGHAAKSKSAVKRFVREIRITDGSIDQYDVGQVLTAALLKEGDKVDIVGRSKGKGFQGVVKRYHFATWDRTHNHEFYRHPGSIGMREDPGRVFPGKKMPGHMGDDKKTAQNLKVVSVEVENNRVLVKGAVPGARGSYIIIQASAKGKFEPRPIKTEAPAANGEAAEDA